MHGAIAPDVDTAWLTVKFEGQQQPGSTLRVVTIIASAAEWTAQCAALTLAVFQWTAP